VEQAVTLVHVARELPSPVINAMPIAEFAETPILMLPLTVAPLLGGLNCYAGGWADIAMDTLDDWAEVLPAAS